MLSYVVFELLYQCINIVYNAGKIIIIILRVVHILNPILVLPYWVEV